MRLFIKNVLLTLLVPSTVAVCAHLLFSGHQLNGSVFFMVSGIVLILLGAALALWAIWCFGVAGRGIHAPIDAPTVLVIQGPYRFIRNPMYCGVILMLTGWSNLFGNFWLLIYSMTVALMFHTFVVLYEERRLRRKFGPAYRQYCQTVGRWIPRVDA